MSAATVAGEALQEQGTAQKRVLALHGFAQSGPFFRQKTGSMRKQMKSVEFVYVDAPCIGTHPTIGEGKSWYEFSDGAAKQAMEWRQFEATLEYLDTVFLEQGPFDGVLGFSQGACVAAVLSAMLEKGSLPPNIKFDFAVLISGFLPRDACYSAICDPAGSGKIRQVRSLHVVGKSDDVVEPARSYKAAEIFERCEFVEHDKGHLVPSDKHVRDAIKAFILASGPDAPDVC